MTKIGIFKPYIKNFYKSIRGKKHSRRKRIEDTNKQFIKEETLLTNKLSK